MHVWYGLQSVRWITAARSRFARVPAIVTSNPLRCSARAARRLAFIAGLVLLTATGAQSTTFTIINNDGAGEGFNDATPRSPQGGNPGTTLGLLRQNAFQEAANRWAAILNSAVVITAGGNFDPLFCTSGSALLGQAGPE